ncbi:Uncharacterised protein [Mycobacteroides abscessus subsp. massiliense]|nr:Uncharacterised protein [Mycobacteroides abscessus subsp. massiliense]
MYPMRPMPSFSDCPSKMPAPISRRPPSTVAFCPSLSSMGLAVSWVRIMSEA